MSAPFDFDRALAAVLDAEGPTIAPQRLVDASLARARSLRQRRPFAAIIDRRSWPARRASLANPVVWRFAVAVLVILALAATIVAVGSLVSRSSDTPTSWAATGALNQPRSDGSVLVLLDDGRVLAIGGGYASADAIAGAEIFDAATSRWTSVPDMHVARSRPSATRLLDGTVLVAGGSAGSQVEASAEVFDPRTGTWTLTDPMSEPRAQHAAVLLPDGRVLVAGGTQGQNPRLAAELYDPASGTWTRTADMTVWRASPSINLLLDGTVLVAGGFGTGYALRATEVYDPRATTWTAVGFMHELRTDDHTGTLLADGRVLVAGGPGSTAEIYDPVTREWTRTTAMGASEGGHAAARLPSGRVLVAGGILGGAALRSVLIFDPAVESWTAAPDLLVPRIGPVYVVLGEGVVLIVGGVDANESVLSSAEVSRSHE
jgi:hypothetical protein